MIRRLAPLALAAILLAGEWVTTEKGERVCQAAVTIQPYTPLDPSMCENYQPGFPKPVYGQNLATMKSWLRALPTGGYQIHTERGWRP